MTKKDNIVLAILLTKTAWYRFLWLPCDDKLVIYGEIRCDSQRPPPTTYLPGRYLLHALRLAGKLLPVPEGLDGDN